MAFKYPTARQEFSSASGDILPRRKQLFHLSRRKLSSQASSVIVLSLCQDDTDFIFYLIRGAYSAQWPHMFMEMIASDHSARQLPSLTTKARQRLSRRLLITIPAKRLVLPRSRGRTPLPGRGSQTLGSRFRILGLQLFSAPFSIRTNLPAPAVCPHLLLGMCANRFRPCRFPACLVTVLSVLILYSSNGKPVDDWRMLNLKLQPQVWMAVLSMLSNASLNFAFIKGVSLTFWRHASRGTTVCLISHRGLHKFSLPHSFADL
jgi:hypothetical protein